MKAKVCVSIKGRDVNQMVEKARKAIEQRAELV